MSREGHRHRGSNPRASWRGHFVASVAGDEKRHCLTLHARSAPTPSRLGSGGGTPRSAFRRTKSPRRLPRTDTLRQILGAWRRYRTPFHGIPTATPRQGRHGHLLARSIYPNARWHWTTPSTDASGRLLQSTFQRRAPESCVVSRAIGTGESEDSRHPIHFAGQPRARSRSPTLHPRAPALASVSPPVWRERPTV